MNWFILLLIPLVALAVVLLYGFSGCSTFSESAADPDPGPAPTGPVATKPAAPSNLVATALDIATIRLTWKDNSGGGADFWLGRLRDDGTWDDTFKHVGTPTTYDDPGLIEGKMYTYRVKAMLGGVTSDESNQVTAKTLEWKKAFDNTGQAATNDQNYKGDCLVQRIDKALLTASGTKVRVTIRAADDVLNFDLATISGPATAVGANPWDPSLPIVPLSGLVSVPKNGMRQLGPVDFAFDKTKDVIIAFDLSATNGATRKVATVMGASAAYIHNDPQASKSVRPATGFSTKANAVYLIETIEVLSA